MKSNDLFLSDDGTAAMSRKSINCIPYFEAFKLNGNDSIFSGKPVLMQKSFFS
jgi:hypothetical protein